MKTSALSLGNKFTVITARKEDDFEYIIPYDLEEWLEKGSWNEHTMFVRDKDEIKNKGTIVLIENLKINLNQKQIEKIMKHVGTRFGPFVSSGEVEITVNNRKCEPEEIKLTSNGKHNINLVTNGIKINGWYGFKLAGALKHNYGFNTYRRNRLITIYDKLGISSTQRSKQIVGEIHIEGVPVTHDKRDWIRESNEFRLVEKELKDFISHKDKDLKKLISG